MMRANRYTLAKLCLLTALAVPMQRTASATVSLATPQTDKTDLMLLAQAGEDSQFVLPDSLEGEGAIAVDGSSSMRSMTTALTEQFQERYPEATVDSAFNGSDAALARLSNGEIDLAAIGRPLTEAETAAGLTAVPIAREKIAIIIGPDNPFSADITFQQFGQIFRGEITDWSELGGEPGPIRFVDRPELSDTRQAFRPYPVFREAPFETGATAETVDADETDAVIDSLGSDGIGYAIANQVMGNSAVKIISMHKTLPDNPAYPFSQPRSYVYAGEANTAVQGFLGVATSEEGESVVQDVQSAEGAAAIDIEGPRPTAESPDGNLTARTSEDNIAFIEDADGNLIGKPLLGAGGAVTALAFSPDGRTLATGTTTGKVRYWNTQNGEALSEVFQPVTGDDSAITDLKFEDNDKLFVGATKGRQGFWGLNGLPFGETAGSAAVGTGAAAESAGLSPWLWLIPFLGLLGAGLWWLLGKGRSSTPAEAPRQTAPTATVTPPVGDPATDREVSNRAQSVITTDRGSADVRGADAEVGELPIVPLPVGAPGVDTTSAAAPDLPLYESTDLESPDLEGTNLDLISPIAAAGGAAAVGGVVFAGLDSGVESDDEDEDVWDDNLDLTLDDAPPSADSADSTGSADTAAETDPGVAGAGLAGAGIVGAGLVGAGIAASRGDGSPTATDSTDIDSTDIESTNIDSTNIDSIEPTRNTVIAETETILDIEPTRETIIGDSAVIFGEAAADVEAAESVSPTQGQVAGVSSAVNDEPDLFATAADSSADTAASLPSPTESPDSAVIASSSASSNAVGVDNLAVGTVAAGMATGAAASIVSHPPTPIAGEPDPLTIEDLASVDDGLAELPEGYGDSRIVLLPRDPQWAYTYWDITNEHKEELRQQGGQRLMLRLYDVTDVDLSVQSPHSMQQQDCHEMARSWYIEVPVSDRDYVSEIGYLTSDDRWLVLARSASVRVPPIYPSDWVKDQFVTIDWKDELEGRTFGDLGQPYSPEVKDTAATELPKIYDDLFAFTEGQDALRVAGSLFGSMHQVLPGGPGALSPSGSGAAINMSGLNVSGLNMSGVGPELGRVRNFWLVADAELIVYGATEPDATLTVGDRVVPLNPDGTFRFHVSFPDGQIDYPIRAVAADGEQSRSIHMHFERETPERNTNTKAEAKDEWF